METIGQTFQKAREQKNVSLSQAAAATRIKIQHIESMERDDFSRIAAATYARGFIKIYAEYLELDPEPLISQYTELHAPQEVTSVVPDESAQSQESNGNGDRSGATWTELTDPAGVARRVLLPVAVIVGLVLALAGAVKLVQNNDAEGNGLGLEDDLVSPVLGEPPDAYLDLDDEVGGRP